VAACLRAVFAAARLAALPGLIKGGGVSAAVTAATVAAMASASGEGSPVPVLGASGAGGVGVGADHAAPAAAEPEHALGVGVGDSVRVAPHIPQGVQRVLAEHAGDGVGDWCGLGLVEHAGVGAGEQQRGGVGGLPRRGGRRSGRGGEVVQRRWCPRRVGA
jgi:hypothetical protein